MGKCSFCDQHSVARCTTRAEASGCDDFKRAGTLAAAARAACVPPRRFKLTDLSKVEGLKSRLDYLQTIRDALTLKPCRVLVDRISLRPELVEPVADAIEQAVDAEAAKVRDALADLGVEV